MLLYRYFSSHAHETLKEAKLKSARVSTFNDPFEVMFQTIGEMTPAKARRNILARLDSPDFLALARRKFPGAITDKELKKLLLRQLPKLIRNVINGFDTFGAHSVERTQYIADMTMRVVCFSSADVKLIDEILLWSHYAKKHEGIRIGFEFPDGMTFPFKIVKMDYQDSRVELDFSSGLQDEAVRANLGKSLKVKSRAWEYENEYRLLTSPSLCKARMLPNSVEEHFVDFKREWVKSVDFGIRCTEHEIKAIVTLLKTDYPSVVPRKADYHKSEFALEYRSL